jgi:3-deoxy-D-manno-octulosonic acid kinase
MRGRGDTWRLDTGEHGEWAVRHYHRGGAIARLLGDRYLTAGVPRPLRELAASEQARTRGVRTPRVEALLVLPHGPYYRADIATRFVPGAADLATVAFAAEHEAGAAAAWRAAGRLIAAAFEAGVVHRDLNLMNVLIQEPGTAEPRALLLDLDGARVGDPVAAAGRKRMLNRFHRSRRKLERRHERRVPPEHIVAFEEGLHG